MTLDYDSHPSALAEVDGGEVKGVKKMVTVDELRKAIPPHCFQSSYARSFFYLFRDFVVVGLLGAGAWNLIPLIEFYPARCAAWLLYGYVQGLQCTGLWVLGHEAGHMAFSPCNTLNDIVGFILHSALLTPYFAWKSTHRRHHIYANNLAKDHNYVPPEADEYARTLKVPAHQLDELTEDAPIATLLRIVLQQLVGWPWYLLANITSSPGALYSQQKPGFLRNSHFLPSSTLFRPEEARLILASDAGLALALGALYLASSRWGAATVALLYGQPYLWVNHWIVAATYLHHTHPRLPKYRADAWTFVKGALATVDHDLGWAGRHMMHNVIEFHVVHHLFSRIPQYHAEEATKAIMPLLGEQYHSDKQRAYCPKLWESFTKCQYVVPDGEADPKKRAFWYRGGPAPPPEINMGKRSWW